MYLWSLRRFLLVAAAVLVPLVLFGAHRWAPLRRTMVGFVTPFAAGPGWICERLAHGLRALVPLRPSERLRLEQAEAHLRQAELRLKVLAGLEHENQELRACLQLPPAPAWQRLAAPVIAREPASWDRRFRIGKGQTHGIEIGNVVLVETEVIGRVAEVSTGTALVVTVADPACRFSVWLPRCGGVGLLNGLVAPTEREVPVCLVDYLPRDLPYDVGDIVLTSGLGDRTPGGLRVGQLIPDEDGSPAQVIDSAYARIHVRPTARFESFRFVAVICRRAPAPARSP